MSNRNAIWIAKVDEEYRLRAQLERMVHPEAKQYAAAGTILGVDRVRGSDSSAGRCEITFLDRGYKADVDAPLEEQTIVTDWLDGGGWKAQIARHIEQVAQTSIRMRPVITQLNEHDESEVSDKGYRRIIWLETFGDKPVDAHTDKPGVESLQAQISFHSKRLNDDQIEAMRAWVEAQGFPPPGHRDDEHLTAILAHVAEILDTTKATR